MRDSSPTRESSTRFSRATDSDVALAVVVPKADAEECIDDLEREGVYDSGRRVREHDADRVELPVTAVPDATDVGGAEYEKTVEQTDPDLRSPDLDALLRDAGWTDDELERAPSSWAVIGSVVLARFEDCPRPGEVGDALLELHGEADTVLDRGGVTGEHREPSVSVVAGAGDTETVHVEHGTRYAMDLDRVMFAPGNEAERVRMGETAGDGERVLDMFAGIGYFAVPMARAGADVTAVETNPEAFRFLAENAQLNDVADRVSCVLGDCRDVDATADRIVMGYYDALGGGPVHGATDSSSGDGVADSDNGDDDPGYLDAALDALVSGGVLHVHSAVPEPELWDRPVDRLRAGCERAGRTVEVEGRRRVKSYSEGVAHVVIDARVE